jgi:transposase
LANSYPESAEWALQWVDRIGNLYHLNGLRLHASIASPERLSAQLVLEQAVQQMALDCSLGVASHELFPPAAKVLQSMTAHWGGLTVFVACPWVDMDNNAAERSMRAPVVGRKNFNGSGSEGSAELAATMYSVFATMKLWGLNLRTWLTTYLQACADNGNAPPVDIDAFLPWQMDAKCLAKMRACHLQEIPESS